MKISFVYGISFVLIAFLSSCNCGSNCGSDKSPAVTTEQEKSVDPTSPLTENKLEGTWVLIASSIVPQGNKEKLLEKSYKIGGTYTTSLVINGVYQILSDSTYSETVMKTADPNYPVGTPTLFNYELVGNILLLSSEYILMHPLKKEKVETVLVELWSKKGVTLTDQDNQYLEKYKQFLAR